MKRGRSERRNPRLRWWHALLVSAAFPNTVLVTLPAEWVVPAAAHATDGHVHVVAASGSPWAGRGDLVVRVDRGEVALKGAEWRWLPARIFAGELAFKVRFNGTATGGVVIVRRMSGLALRDVEMTLPVAAVAEGVGPLRGWNPGGILVFRTRTLDLGPRGAAGDAELLWRDASTVGSPLGDFRCLLQAVPGAAARLTITTLRGPLQVSAAGEVGAGGALRLRGTASSAPDHRDRLRPLLLALGHDRGDGAVAFDIAVSRRGPA
jgi:hypothetical protein